MSNTHTCHIKRHSSDTLHEKKIVVIRKSVYEKRRKARKMGDFDILSNQADFVTVTFDFMDGNTSMVSVRARRGDSVRSCMQSANIGPETLLMMNGSVLSSDKIFTDISRDNGNFYISCFSSGNSFNNNTNLDDKSMSDPCTEIPVLQDLILDCLPNLGLPLSPYDSIRLFVNSDVASCNDISVVFIKDDKLPALQTAWDEDDNVVTVRLSQTNHTCWLPGHSYRFAIKYKNCPVGDTISFDILNFPSIDKPWQCFVHLPYNAMLCEHNAFLQQQHFQQQQQNRNRGEGGGLHLNVFGRPSMIAFPRHEGSLVEVRMENFADEEDQEQEIVDVVVDGDDGNGDDDDDDDSEYVVDEENVEETEIAREVEQEHAAAMDAAPDPLPQDARPFHAVLNAMFVALSNNEAERFLLPPPIFVPAMQIQQVNIQQPMPLTARHEQIVKSVMVPFYVPDGRGVPNAHCIVSYLTRRIAEFLGVQHINPLNYNMYHCDQLLSGQETLLNAAALWKLLKMDPCHSMQNFVYARRPSSRHVF
jgi:hypothetical protein